MLSSTMSYYEQRRINTNLISNLWAREFGAIDRLKFHRQLQGSANLIDRLDQSGLLVGHEGCVNCLEWSSDGRILASGSDDFHVMLWDPFRKKSISRLRTNHMGNLFSVKFLPQHCNTKIATGAADKYIYVFDINQHNEPLLYCNCHTMRVKRLATAPDEANIFWSAAEDGSVLQLDIREKHVCRSKENRYRLINLSTYLNTHAEIKCIAINPRRTEYIAVGSNDPYARIYDRRMLRMTSTYVPEGANRDEIGEARQPCMPKGCVTYYCPGHISHNNPRVIDHESRAITYLTYNAAGTELLVNMGGEHVYLYDLLNAEHPTFLNLPAYKPPTTPTPDIEMPEADADATTQTAAAGDATAETKACAANGSTAAASAAATKRPKLPDHIEALKKLGNDFLENEKYLRAIEKYSEAIALAPECAVLYLNRATAYMRRLWFGDVYAALRDCHQALNLDPSYIKAHFRLARALLELGRPSDADSCLKELIARFSSYADNHGILMLAKDIRENPPSSTQQTNNRTADPNSPMGYYYNEMITEISTDEHEMRSKAKDYEQRFVGHCNTKTDIKEANYFGYNGDYIVAGSDDGNFYLWERKTCMIHSVYRADSAIVNCVQPHPEICMMATSGIDREIRLWEPIAEEGEERTSSVIANKDKWVEDNQQKMKTDPFDLNSRNAYCLSS